MPGLLPSTASARGWHPSGERRPAECEEGEPHQTDDLRDGEIEAEPEHDLDREHDQGHDGSERRGVPHEPGGPGGEARDGEEREQHTDECRAFVSR